MRDVVDLIVARGSGTLDELCPEFPGFTRQQVLNAMRNARTEGLIHSSGIVRRKGCARSMVAVASRHYPGAKTGDVSHAPTLRRPPNSAWELASERPAVSVWPPQISEPRRHAPLGPWNEVA